MLRVIALFFLWFFLSGLTLWATAALYIDVRHHAVRIPLAILYVVIVAVDVWKVHGAAKPALVLVAFLVVLAWWLSLKPTNFADWQANVAHLAQVEIDGNVVTIHNFRNCDY